MGKVEIFALIFAGVILGVRLYLKYLKKNTNNTKGIPKKSGDELISSSIDDEYEPYIRK